jgi:hypothetical protein
MMRKAKNGGRKDFHSQAREVRNKGGVRLHNLMFHKPFEHYQNSSLSPTKILMRISTSSTNHHNLKQSYKQPHPSSQTK